MEKSEDNFPPPRRRCSWPLFLPNSFAGINLCLVHAVREQNLLRMVEQHDRWDHQPQRRQRRRRVPPHTVSDVSSA